MEFQAFRREFPLLERVVWLASAGTGPMPKRALERIQQALRTGFDPTAFEEGISQKVRDLVARLLSVDPVEVALTRSTTEGLNAVAAALPWSRGDNVVITDQEYPANAIPWYHQGHLHGIEVRVVGSREGRLPLDAFAEAVAGGADAATVARRQAAGLTAIDAARTAARRPPRQPAP